MVLINAKTVAALAALAHPALAARQYSVRSYTPAASQASSGNKVVSSVLSLKKSTKAARSSKYLSAMQSGITNASFAYEHTDNLLSEEYIAEIEWDGVPVQVIIDTGSSDT